MKKFLTLIFATGTFLCSAQQALYDVTAGDGNGVRFWASNNYKIHMGNVAEYHYGPVTDYSIKMNMDVTAGRGWTWGINGVAPVAALGSQGNMQIAGTFTSIGNSTTNNLLFGKYGSTLDGSTDPFVIASLSGGTQDLIVYGDSGPNVLNLRLHDGALKMGSPTTPNAVINNDGSAYFINNVGIGTTSPVQKLDVRGNLVLENGGNPSLFTGTGATELNRYLYLLNSSSAGSASGLKAGGVLVSDSYSYANPGKNDLIVKGNVGIGTASPDAKLAVAGQVHAQEVKVSITVPGPDYVFDQDYKLSSLQEIETYIDQNKHLPEVPSAKEMEKDGVQLGEMNMLLLKKIEELTLHLIEQNKKIEELERLVKK